MSNMVSLEQIAVHVVPTAAFTDEAASLVDAHGWPRTLCRPITRHKLDLGMVGIDGAAVANLQPQPARAMVRPNIGWPVLGVPATLQVVGTAQNKGAVTRAHQAFGIGRGGVGKVIKIQAAAGIQREWFAMATPAPARAGNER